MIITKKKILLLLQLCLMFTLTLPTTGQTIPTLRTLQGLPNNERDLLLPGYTPPTTLSLENQNDLSEEEEKANNLNTPNKLSSIEKQFNTTSKLDPSGFYVTPKTTPFTPNQPAYMTYLTPPSPNFSVAPGFSTVPTSANTLLEDSELKPSPILQFGYSFFENKKRSIIFNDANVRSNYVLGPGDSLIIRTWGKLDQTLSLTIDKSGHIFIPKIGNIYLNGVEYGNAPAVIRREIEKSFINFDISVTLGSLRSVKIFVLGDVVNPGTYDVTALNTVFHGLILSGGPSKTGSLRTIRLKRANGEVKSIDLYRYLLTGDNDQDPLVQAYDTIFVPPIGSVIKVAGQVKRPGIYELAGHTTAYDAVFNFAGGPATFGYQQRLQIERIDGGNSIVLLDIPISSPSALESTLKKVAMKDGDSIKIHPINQTKENYIEATGAVKRPGYYEFTPGITIQDVIQHADGLSRDAYLTKVDIYRTHANDFTEIISVDLNSPNGPKTKLKNLDQLKFYTQQEALGSPIVELLGSAKQPGVYTWLDNMRVLDLVFLGGLDNSLDFSKVQIYRKDASNKDMVFEINLNEVMKNPSSNQNVLLKPYDRVFLRRNEVANRYKTITLSGQVQFPGIYPVSEDDTLKTIIDRAGGFTSNAFPKGAVYKRASLVELQYKGQEKLLVEEKKRLLYGIQNFEHLSESTYLVYQESLSYLNKVIESNSGRLIINIDKVLSSDSKFKIEHNDALYIPAFTRTVQVLGGVQQSISVEYLEGKAAPYYIKQVGGYSRYADKRRVYVIKPDGSISDKGRNIEAGDTIYIPEHVVVPINWWKMITDVTSLFYQIAIGLSVLN